MDLAQVDRSWGEAAACWVWSTRPRYVFEEDGSERGDLEPVENVTSEHYGDEVGWWTCHPETKRGDLAVMYRSAGTADRNYPVLGPKDLRYICMATSDAFSLSEDPLAGEFARHHGCRYVVVSQLEPPIGIDELRADPVMRSWPALRAGFVQASMPLPKQVWRRLVEMSHTTATPGHGRRRSESQVTLAERIYLEERLEEWLEQHPEALKDLGFDVSVVQRQMLCAPGHDGSIDLLCRDNGDASAYLAIELKADEVKRDAIAQVLGYVGWLRSRPEVDRAAALIVGLEPHVQVPWVIDVLPADIVHVAHWTGLGLPADLAAELRLDAQPAES